jgi:Na+/H+-dicarboxylate symporter
MTPPRTPRLALHWKILIGLTLGVIFGLILKEFNKQLWSAAPEGSFLAGLFNFLIQLAWLIGELFKRSLSFIAVPIILFALIHAIGSLGDFRKLGRLGGKTVGIFACVIVGLVLVNVIQPGGPRFISEAGRTLIIEKTKGQVQKASELANTAKSTKAWDLIADIVPKNPFKALAEGEMLQVVFLALMIGIALTILPRERSRPLLELSETLTEVFTTIVRWIVRAAPVGVFCLITPIVATLGFDVLLALGAYCITVLLGLAVIQLVIYPAVVRIFSPITVRQFFRGIAQVQMVAFSSSSSAATLPVTIANVRDKLGVPPDITGFVCAFGVKINMDGTAMMQGVATVFLAQFYGMGLGLVQQATIVITAVMSAIGTPGIPSGGMVMLVIVLKTYGVPTEGIAMILAVDRILDMCRTIVNVTGDAAVAVAVAGSEKQLKPM